MNKDDVIRLLAEFFRDAFRDDAPGVADWFAQGDHDIEAFVAELDQLAPTDAGSSK